MRNFSRTLTPEQFDAKVIVYPDGRYAYSYVGTLTFVPALVQSARVKVCERCEAQLKKLSAQLLQEGFRKADYIGDGRYRVIFEGDRAKDEPLFFLSRENPAFSVMPQLDGAIMIGAFRSDGSPMRGYNGSGAETDGSLNVTVESGIRVIRHNAQEEPLMHGSFAEYYWRINLRTAAPFIVMQATR